MSGAIALSAADFPGYAEAVARENLIRAAACMGVNENICGIEVLPLTSRHVRWLAFINSPFLLRGVTTDQLCQKPDIDLDALLFLWIVSPKYRAGNIRARNRFYRKNKAVQKLPINEVVREILNYVDEAYLDSGNPSSETRSYYAFEISIVTSLHRHYGLPIDFWETGRIRNFIRRITGKPSPLDVPLKIFWQLEKIERRMADPETPLSNYSCSLISKALTKISEQQKKIQRDNIEYAESLKKERCDISPGDSNYWDYGQN